MNRLGIASLAVVWNILLCSWNAPIQLSAPASLTSIKDARLESDSWITITNSMRVLSFTLEILVKEPSKAASQYKSAYASARAKKKKKVSSIGASSRGTLKLIFGSSYDGKSENCGKKILFFYKESTKCFLKVNRQHNCIFFCRVLWPIVVSNNAQHKLTENDSATYNVDLQKHCDRSIKWNKNVPLLVYAQQKLKCGWLIL